ncbi:hypothetical protein GJ744_011909 [Endocarpon pusillum]|uniref:NACHT domain-containing protein n=1 Tax=Endocarpon pusillum TaxID=364733 RepID=A0A8H7E4G9_9EURO|nr:hypothetical protein GJ744_011909 [Endocarpon pusillum]
MDPLSISASIAAVLTLTGTVIQYLNNLKGAPKDRERILLELCNVNGMLYMLQDQAEQAQQADSWSLTLQSLNMPNGPIKQFKTALERLAKRMAPVEGLGKVTKAITWPFQKEEINEILNSIERQKTLFNLARQNDHIALSKAIKGDIARLRSTVGEVDKNVARLQIDSHHETIRRWLAAPDPSINYNKALRDRHARTGTWFIESKIFADWKSVPALFLCLYGIPGCGKTILSSTILEDVLDHCSLKPDLAVLYFYFDFNDIEKQQHEKMIHSLIVQLYSQCTGTSKDLETLYSSCMNGERQPTCDKLLATLHQMMGSFKEIYLILDALDECSDRLALLVDIEEFNSWKDANLHILTTSRRERDIEEFLEPFNEDQGKISIQSTLVNDDIRAYVHDRLQTDRSLKRWQKELKVLQEIENALMEKANGMFRWAACQLDSLGSCLNIHGLRKALASLPKTLDDTYARILCNIDEDHRRYALKILQWLTYSVRPLRLEEVAEVIAIDVEESPRFDPEKRLPEPRDILTICSSLISLEEKAFANAQVIVRLAHFSVKEYLVSERIRHGRAKDYSLKEIATNALLAEDCLAYLLQFDELDSSNSQPLTDFPLAGYAAKYWTQHAGVAERSTNLASLLSLELLTEGHCFVNCIRLYNPEEPWPKLDMTIGLNNVYPPLYYASLTGLSESVKLLLDKGADVKAQGGLYNNALQAASIGGHDQVVQILLDKGADVNAQGGIFDNALIVASLEGHDQVVQILLDKGADVNAQGGIFSNALHAASERGHDQVVKILLDKGADVDAQGGLFNNALRAASIGGHDQVVQILLDKGADVNAQGGIFDNALIVASLEGHDQVVQILLDKGADVNAQGGIFRNALLEASMGGHDKVVQILLDKGADVDAQGASYINALHAASERGHDRVVQILLDKGDDVNALYAALEGGHDQVVKMLLDKGADVNALQAASKRGHDQVVQLLRDSMAKRAQRDMVTRSHSL